jgi:hypothetical protein
MPLSSEAPPPKSIPAIISGPDVRRYAANYAGDCRPQMSRSEKGDGQSRAEDEVGAIALIRFASSDGWFFESWTIISDKRLPFRPRPLLGRTNVERGIGSGVLRRMKASACRIVAKARSVIFPPWWARTALQGKELSGVRTTRPLMEIICPPSLSQLSCLASSAAGRSKVNWNAFVGRYDNDGSLVVSAGEQGGN